MFELKDGNTGEVLKKIRQHKKMVANAIEQVYSENMDGKKLLELSNAGKFLANLDETARVVAMDERPDFIVEIDGNRIGLEHRVIRNAHASVVGSLEALVNAAGNEFAKQYSEIKILANVYVKPFSFKKSERKKLIDQIVAYIYVVQSNQQAEKPAFIDKILLLPDKNGPRLIYNPGFHASPDLTKLALLEAIDNKNEKVEYYKQNSGLDRQWLLIIINELGPASPEIDELEVTSEIETGFERIYVFEDYKNELTRIV
jgi:hypothetical protein